MEKLVEILKEFDKQRNEAQLQKQWDVDAVAKWFVPCAEAILCGGYFLVNNEFIIDIGSIELYYHEEQGLIKDHVMYHTNEHLPKNCKELIKNDGGYPYFKLGSFNLHTSGVDVTFENAVEKYRASFLIRSYRVIKKNNVEEVKFDRVKFDECSTHIFDDMFYEGISFENASGCSIHWIPCTKGGRIEQQTRKNVAEYREKINDKGVLVFEKEEVDPKACLESARFKYGDKHYKKEARKWRFDRVFETPKEKK